MIETRLDYCFYNVQARAAAVAVSTRIMVPAGMVGNIAEKRAAMTNGREPSHFPPTATAIRHFACYCGENKAHFLKSYSWTSRYRIGQARPVCVIVSALNGRFEFDFE